jgi:hypothetical protein
LAEFSLANLFTVPIAAVLAALLLGQIPPLGLLPGLALLLAGAAFVISSTRPGSAVTALRRG